VDDGGGQRRVGIVPHTHWDREWYAPFQAYRLRLVRLLDDLLPRLENDGTFAHFCLDGQTAVIDDYLEVRPGAEERLRRLAAAGRVSVGPWAILMDEFMVSGETIVRNLQRGQAWAATLGGAMPVGYLPDMFGHVAQMPQILRLAGLEHAVVWRGVPSAVTTTGFWWEAPDGSTVRAEYLYGSYSNGRDLPEDGAGIVERARNYEAELGPARIGGLLLMNGTDHQMPQPGVGAAAAEANAAQDEYRFEITSLARYLAAEPVEGLPTWRGELRSGARANLLMGVASNRVDVKAAAAAAERALQRRAEPVLALFRPPAEWAGAAALLDVGWRNLILNSAHDSSCACSHDEVVDQVLVRYREARQIGDGLTAEATRAMAGEIRAEPGSLVVVNALARERAGLVEARVPGLGPLHFRAPDGSARATQPLETDNRLVFDTVVAGRKLLWVLDMMRGREFGGRRIRSWELEAAPAGVGHQLTIQAAWPGEEGIDLAVLRRDLATLVEAGEPVAVRCVEGPLRRVLIETGAVEGFGWATLSPVDGPGPEPQPPVRAGSGDQSGAFLDNGLVRVEVDGTDGTFRLVTADGLEVGGLNRYVDGGDGGDTYNWSPPTADRLVERPESVAVEVTEEGPLRARVVVSATYRWPAHAEGDQRSCTSRAATMFEAAVRTTIELRAGDLVVAVEVEIDNRSRDHRLRAHFPLPAPVDGSEAECAFAVVRRGLEAEGGPSEHGLPTFPARRFVDCRSEGGAGLALIADGLLEYEVVADGREVALTLLRATGWLSRLEPALRPNAAGPAIAVEGAQMLGRQLRRYGVLVHAGGWREAELYRRADEFLLPFEVAPVGPGPQPHGGERPPAGRSLRVTGAEVSAVLRDGAALIVRLFNPAPEPVVADVGGTGPGTRGCPPSGSVVDLTGRVLRPFPGQVGLRPGEIATLRLEYP
jgi:mannosylglycerate hydrolase